MRYAPSAMNAHKLPNGLRKHIRKQKGKIRRQTLSQTEADEKIHEFLRGLIRNYDKVK